MREFCAYFHCACAETAIYCETSIPVKNLTTPFAPATSISYKTDVFPPLSDVYGIYSIFCGIRCMTLWLTVDLLTLRVFHEQCFSFPTHIPIFMILKLSVIELLYDYWIIWSHLRYQKQSLRMRRVTWPVHRGSTKTTRDNFLTPNYLFTIKLLWGYDDDVFM